MKATIIAAAIPNVYDLKRVARWVICDFDRATAQDEINTDLETMTYEDAHAKHMEYLDGLRSQGMVVTHKKCGTPNCSHCEDDHQQVWDYVSASGERRAVCLFSRE